MITWAGGTQLAGKIIAAMEKVYQYREANRTKAAERAKKLKDFDWATVNDQLLNTVLV